MRSGLREVHLALCLAPAFALLSVASNAAEPARVVRGGGVEVAGREVKCANVQTRLDRRLPNLGAASPEARIMILNPTLLRRYSETVQLFVFHHECGHHQVGQSELGADCWAVGQGVRDGWLDRNGLVDVCRSFNNAPPTPTHPSGQRRCANIDKCFAKAEFEIAQLKPAPAPKPATPPVAVIPAKAVPARAADPTPQLVTGPRLIRTSVVR